MAIEGLPVIPATNEHIRAVAGTESEPGHLSHTELNDYGRAKMVIEGGGQCLAIDCDECNLCHGGVKLCLAYEEHQAELWPQAYNLVSQIPQHETPAYF